MKKTVNGSALPVCVESREEHAYRLVGECMKHNLQLSWQKYLEKAEASIDWVKIFESVIHKKEDSIK